MQSSAALTSALSHHSSHEAYHNQPQHYRTGSGASNKNSILRHAPPSAHETPLLGSHRHDNSSVKQQGRRRLNVHFQQQPGMDLFHEKEQARPDTSQIQQSLFHPSYNVQSHSNSHFDNDERIQLQRPQQYKNIRPSLILDASGGGGGATAGLNAPILSSTSSDLSSSQRSAASFSSSFWTPAAQRFTSRLFGSTSADTPMLEPSQQTATNEKQQYEDRNDSVSDLSAASLARKEHHMAGYLCKLGTNIPQMKRRFFVLVPSHTCLYYFLGPHDTTPRGCFDLQHSVVHEEGELTDGRFRFVIVWPSTRHCDDDTHRNNNQQSHKVLLEARSRDIGLAWMQALETERFDVYKSRFERTTQALSASQSRIAELERQVAAYKLIEKDRDGALQDSEQQKEQFYKLDEALRQLTQMMRVPLEPVKHASSLNENAHHTAHNEDKRSSSDGNSNIGNKTIDGKEEVQILVSDKKAADTGHFHAAIIDVSESTAKDGLQNSPLLGDVEKPIMLNVMNVPGSHFGSLYNACEQLRENCRLASTEASTALDDLEVATAQIKTMEKRMTKAEKHLCKLWEENCTIRNVVKLKKREKRVLVREVKNLRQALEQQKKHTTSASNHWTSQQSTHEGVAGKLNAARDGDSIAESDEEKLIFELEEHLMSSIRLHEQLLVAGGDQKQNVATKRVQCDLFDSSFASEQTSDCGIGPVPAKLSDVSISSAICKSESQSCLSKNTKPIASLFDNDSDTEESETNMNGDEPRSSAVSVSSVDIEVDGEPHDVDIIGADSQDVDSSPDRFKPQAPNPMLQLDDDDQPHLCTVSSQSESSKSVVTSTGQATNKLTCPLVDVAETRPVRPTHFSEIEHETYHLTFYSRKIGLQFQKVPPPPKRAKGLLTEAMTADISGGAMRSSKTAAELRRISAISTRAKTDIIVGDDHCEIAMPVHAVLVCGFEGFDDSGTNVRPKLGARLVAFDGISVEIGRWTFDSIRKAIHSRERPLTLSFRNDFLTSEQRAILTKAVNDLERLQVPLRANPQMVQSRRPSIDPSIQSGLSSESDFYVKDSRNSYRSHEDGLSVSASGSDNYQTLPQSFSGSRSLSSSFGNFRSLSEAGSTASVLSAVAPLVANLLSRRETAPFTPRYLRRSESVENIPQHQDFKSELL